MDITQSIMFIMPLAKWHLEGGNGYENLVWDDLFYPKPSEEQLEEAYDLSQKAIEAQSDYRLLRREHYPTAEAQLAMIFDVGIDGWKSYIQNVKNNIPKIK
jgi:hypothetical protein